MIIEVLQALTEDRQADAALIWSWLRLVTQDILASARDDEVMLPADVCISMSLKPALRSPSVLRSGCTASQIFFFCTCIKAKVAIIFVASAMCAVC